MKDQKTKVILHGGFSRVDNELNRSFFAALVQDVPQGGTVLLCYFAYEDNYSKHIAAHTEYIHATRGDVQIVVASREGFEEEVRGAHALYLNGGDTEKLIALLRGYPFSSMIHGKVVGGSSAGAYALAVRAAAHDEPHAHTGLGLVPYNVVCHYHSEKLPPTETSVRELEEDAGRETVYLRDYEWRMVYLPQ